MSTRSAKRIYTRSSIESWFSRLEAPWEGFFSESELALGRELYRLGEVREVELGAEDAIIHCKRDKQGCYAFLEWRKGEIGVRFSTPDRDFGRALAVAGLYEIEELVADESAAVTLDEFGEVLVETPSAHSPGRSAPAPDRPSRTLLVKLGPTSQGVRLQAFWESALTVRVSALGEEAEAGLTETEREKLIRLTSRAHQSKFVARPKSGDYLLRDLDSIPAFLRDELPRWKRYFQIQIDSRLSKLGQGSQKVILEAEAVQGRDGWQVNWKARLGERWLRPEDCGLLFKSHRHRVLSPELGLLHLGEDQAQVMVEWQGGCRTGENGQPPPYLLFSLFQQNAIAVTMSPEMQQWRDRMLRPPEQTIEGAPACLRPYQRQGIAWLSHLCAGGCHPLLADEMGLGKTLQTLTLLARVRPLAGLPHLIVCPASVIPVWLGEMARFYPDLSAEVVRNGRHWQSVPEPRIWVSSYAQLRRHRALLGGIEFGYAILDEAQFIKNPEAKVTHACLEIRARHRLALTGTPLENRHLDLWTLFRFLMPGLLGSQRQLKDRLLSHPVELEARLRRQIAPFVMRRTKQAVLDELPSKVEAILTCPLTAVQEQEYRRMVSEGVLTLGDDVKTAARTQTVSFFTLLTRLRQVCCDPHLLPWWSEDNPAQSGKISLLRERLREIVASGHKAVIFSQFVALLKRVRTALAVDLPAVPVFELTGQTVDRAKPVADFQALDGPGIFLASLKAGGTGITLHAADYVFLLDPWWNPAVENQAIDRVHRIGQHKTVFVYRLIAPGTVEERVEWLKRDKRELFASLVGNLNVLPGEWLGHFRNLGQLIDYTPPPGLEEPVNGHEPVQPVTG